MKYNTSQIKEIEIKEDKQKIDKSTSKTNNQETDFDKHFALVECLEEDISADCSDELLTPKKVLGVKITHEETLQKKNEYKMFYDLKNSNFIIIIIYVLLIYTLAKQICLYLWSKNKNLLNEIDFHKAEWNINTAPMFGLLGTFFSIAILLSNTGTEDISNILLKNFFDAVMTTIIGIIFYIINFKLKIDIYPVVKFNE